MYNYYLIYYQHSTFVKDCIYMCVNYVTILHGILTLLYY